MRSLEVLLKIVPAKEKKPPIKLAFDACHTTTIFERTQSISCYTQLNSMHQTRLEHFNYDLASAMSNTRARATFVNMDIRLGLRVVRAVKAFI